MKAVIGTSSSESPAVVVVGPLSELPGEIARTVDRLESRGYATEVIELIDTTDDIDYVINNERRWWT